MGVLEASIIHHVGMVLAFIWAISSLGRCYPVVYFACLVYLYMVNGRYTIRLKKRLQFEERKHANQRRLLSDTETVRWLNHAVEKVWPICMEQIASQQFLLPVIPWFLEKYKPWTAKKAVVQQLYLGRSPPVFTEIRVLRQSTDDDHLVLELGMNFLSADDMSAILAVKLRKRLGFGMWAKMHITGMHVEGRVLVGLKFLRKWPFLGRLRLCFVEPPFFQMTVKPIFSHGLDVTELPGIAGWLDKLLAVAFEETLVEPNMLVVDVEKFVSSPTEGWFTMDEKSAIAYAKVEILEAADMKPSDLNGLADPYIKGHLGSHRFQTKIQRKTLSPKWLEEFTMPITSWEAANVLVLEARDKDHIFDDTLGECSVGIGELRGGQRHDMWLPLKNIKMGRLHLAVTVLEGDAAAAADKVKECGDGEQNDGEEQQVKVSEDAGTPPGAAAAAKSNWSRDVAQPNVKAADEYESIDIQGQEKTGIWVHRPGSDVSQKWQPRTARDRHPDTQVHRGELDCTNGRSRLLAPAAGSQQPDSSSDDDDDHPDGRRVRPLGTIRRGMKKIGSLFHNKSPRSEIPPGDAVENPVTTPRPNLRARGEKTVSVGIVLDDDDDDDEGEEVVSSGMERMDAGGLRVKGEAESQGKEGNTKVEVTRSILKQVGKSAHHHLKSVLSRKGSNKSKEGRTGTPEEEEEEDANTSSHAAAAEEYSCPTAPKEDHRQHTVTIDDGVPLSGSASPPPPPIGEEGSPIKMEAEGGGVAKEAVVAAEPNSPTGTLEASSGHKGVEGDGGGVVDSPRVGGAIKGHETYSSSQKGVFRGSRGQGGGGGGEEPAKAYLPPIS